MRKIRGILPALVFSSLIGVLLFLIPSAGQRFPVPPCENQEETYRPENGESVIHPMVSEVVCFVHRTRDDINALSTLVVAIFTTVLGVFTVRLASSTDKAARAAQESAAVIPTLERAFVFVEVVEAEIYAPVRAVDKERFNAASKATLRIRLSNKGRTPGIVDRLVAMAEFMEDVPTELDTVRLAETFADDNRLILLGADESTREITLKSANVLESQDQERYASKKLFLYCWGEVHYRDIFGVERTTRFCRRNGHPGELVKSFDAVGGYKRNRVD